MKRASVLSLLLALCALSSTSVFAQQRPLDTQDPETIVAGRVLFEAGISEAHNQFYTLSGLKGDLWQLPILGLDFGISSIADIQITAGPYDSLSISSRQ